MLRESIKDASMTDLKDFLENIRKYSPKMGEIAMRHAGRLSMPLPTYHLVTWSWIIKADL